MVKRAILGVALVAALGAGIVSDLHSASAGVTWCRSCASLMAPPPPPSPDSAPTADLS